MNITKPPAVAGRIHCAQLRRLQRQIRDVVASHYRPTEASDPMDPAFLIWKHGPTLAWALGRYVEELEAGCPPALRRAAAQEVAA